MINNIILAVYGAMVGIGIEIDSHTPHFMHNSPMPCYNFHLMLRLFAAALPCRPSAGAAGAAGAPERTMAWHSCHIHLLFMSKIALFAEAPSHTSSRRCPFISSGSAPKSLHIHTEWNPGIMGINGVDDAGPSRRLHIFAIREKSKIRVCLHGHT